MGAALAGGGDRDRVRAVARAAGASASAGTGTGTGTERQRPEADACRSAEPVHPVCAIGPAAAADTRTGFARRRIARNRRAEGHSAADGPRSWKRPVRPAIRAEFPGPESGYSGLY